MIWVSRLCILLATLVVLLHTIVAHEHVTTMNSEAYWTSHHKAKTFFDNVLAFHIDAGSGHLETFVDDDADNLDDCLFTPEIRILPVGLAEFTGSKITKTNKDVERKSTGPRGPPINS